MEQHGSYGINIRSVVCPSLRYFRCTEPFCSRHSQIFTLHRTKSIDIEQGDIIRIDLKITVVLYKEIRRLDIHMHQSGCMKRFNTVRQRIHHTQNDL